MGMRVMHLLSLYDHFVVLRLLCAVVRMLKSSYLLAISFSGNILMLSIVGVKTVWCAENVKGWVRFIYMSTGLLFWC